MGINVITPRSQKNYGIDVESGFTLIELLIGTVVGAILIFVTGNLLLSTVYSGRNLESSHRSRNDWNRTSHFIESEIALSERVITDQNNLNLEYCPTSINEIDFKFGLEIRRHLPPVIYFTRNNEDNSTEWYGDLSMWRCGPKIDEQGEYSFDVEEARVVDSMTNECKIEVSSSTNSISKAINFTLCLQKSNTAPAYTQTINAYTRISPVFSYPNANTLCSNETRTIEGFYKLNGGTIGSDLLELSSNVEGLSIYDDILICGYGGGDTIKGSTANDVLEAGDSGSSSETGATINAYSGSDRLVGGPGNDQLYGGDGDDVLISGSGNDTLNGGSGDNQYLAGAGNNIVLGGTGLDVVFLDQSKADVSGLANCSRSSCLVTYSVDGLASQISATGIEVIIFRDGRFDITN